VGGTFDPCAIGILFNGTMGNTLNSTDANYDKLYFGIEDTLGNVGVVYYDSDTYAAQRAISIGSGNLATREFKIALTDLTSPNNVDITKMRKVFAGIGGERGAFKGLYSGGTGTMEYDNIKLYVRHCNPSYLMQSMVTGDLAGPMQGQLSGDHSKYVPPDCVVDFSDIHFLMDDWLFAEPNLDYTGTMSDPGTSNLTVWYKFDEGSGTAITDSSINGRDGTLYNPGPFAWWYRGHDDANYCINLEPGYHTWIECPNSVMAGDSTGQTFTFWLKYNERFLQDHTWSSVLVTFSSDPNGGDDQTMETQLPVPIQNGGAPPWLRWVDMRVSLETGLQHARPSLIYTRWNHYALVYDTGNQQMRMYVNGEQIAGENNASFTIPYGPTEAGGANTVRIGTRGNSGGYGIDAGWGWWYGRVDDMKLYSTVLSNGEIEYLATDGTGERDLQALFNEPDNFETSTVTLPGASETVQIINFLDYNVLAGYWLDQQLWP
jgi:hypothetical protein